MGYIESNLMQNEQVVHRGEIHWIIFIPGILGIIIGFFLFGIGAQSGAALILLFGIFIVILAIYGLIKAFITKISTELAVTSKRVIAKTGFIRRNTVELNHRKVESFNVEQGILGRIIGFGTIVVCGTGGGRTTPIPNIKKPLEFRRHAMQTIDEGASSPNTA